MIGLLFLCLLLCLAVLFIGLTVAVIAGFLREKKIVIWTIGITLTLVVSIAIASPLIIAYLYRPYDPASEAELQRAYQADFGELPAQGIKVLKARQIIIFDAGGQWLLLEATPKEIERHIEMGFKPAKTTPSDFNGEAGANAPAWWQPPTDQLELYENQNWSKAGGWSSSEASMGVDRSSGLIWFAASKFN